MQLGSRNPALLATSALSLPEISDGRFLLGIGTSGPRVMKGWHGVRFHRPVQTTRDTVEIFASSPEGTVSSTLGEIYPLPFAPQQGHRPAAPRATASTRGPSVDQKTL